MIGPSIFLLGAAGGHIYQMITAHNFAPGNAGVIFWTDILLPVIGFVLLWLSARSAGTEMRKSSTTTFAEAVNTQRAKAC